MAEHKSINANSSGSFCSSDRSGMLWMPPRHRIGSVFVSNFRILRTIRRCTQGECSTKRCRVVGVKRPDATPAKEQSMSQPGIVTAVRTARGRPVAIFRFRMTYVRGTSLVGYPRTPFSFLRSRGTVTVTVAPARSLGLTTARADVIRRGTTRQR